MYCVPNCVVKPHKTIFYLRLVSCFADLNSSLIYKSLQLVLSKPQSKVNISIQLKTPGQEQ